MYKNALEGKIKNVVGIDLPFKKPKGSNLYIENNMTKSKLYDKIKKILLYIKKSNTKIF